MWLLRESGLTITGAIGKDAVPLARRGDSKTSSPVSPGQYEALAAVAGDATLEDDGPRDVTLEAEPPPTGLLKLYPPRVATREVDPSPGGLHIT